MGKVTVKTGLYSMFFILIFIIVMMLLSVFFQKQSDAYAIVKLMILNNATVEEIMGTPIEFGAGLSGNYKEREGGTRYKFAIYGPKADAEVEAWLNWKPNSDEWDMPQIDLKFSTGQELRI